MDVRNFLFFGFSAGVLFLVLDMVFAVAAMPFLLSYSGLPVFKNPPDVSSGVVFDLINGFILASVYIILYKGIPGLGWRKGFNYGVIVGLFRVVMASFSGIVMYNIPSVVVAVNLISGYLEIILLCVLLALIHEKILK